MHQFVIITEQNITVLNPIETVREFVAAYCATFKPVFYPKFYRFCDYIPRYLDLSDLSEFQIDVNYHNLNNIVSCLH